MRFVNISNRTWVKPSVLVLLSRRPMVCGALLASRAATFSGGVKTNARLPCGQRLPDGSYLSYVYPSDKDRRQATNGVKIRVIEYRLEGVADAEPIYRLVTSILDPAMTSASELAAFYHERGRSRPRWTNTHVHGTGRPTGSRAR